jgi:hypothetical protein
MARSLLTRPALLAGAAATAVAFALSIRLAAPALTPPVNIVAFELAGTPDSATALLQAWGPAGTTYLRQSLWLDFGLIAGYTAFLTLACFLLRNRWQAQWPRLATLANLLGAGMLLAGACDVLENVALLQVLGASASPTWPALAAVAARVKFALLIVGTPFTWVGALVTLASSPLTSAKR